MNLSLASIHVYPIKSLGGFAVEKARLTDRGLEYDRRWMLVDVDGSFVTQRECAALACLHTSPNTGGFKVVDTRNGDALNIPWHIDHTTERMCSVWRDRVRTVEGDPAWNSWFSDRLDRKVILVYMPDGTKRRTDGRYAKGYTSLSDGFPYMIISQASLDDLNARLPEPVPMDRFRPNLVVAGGLAFQEDGWEEIRIGEALFKLVKPCARCAIVTTDQRTGSRSKEPLRTLASYRSNGAKVLFGMNAMGPESGLISKSDPIQP